MLVSLFLLTSCGTSTYMTVGGQKVSYDLVKSFVRNHTSAYTEEELKDEALREELREKILKDLRMTFVILAVAEELSVKMTPAAKANMKEELEFYQSLGDDYELLLKAQFATEAVFKKLLEISAYDNLVFDAITDGAALKGEGDRFAASVEQIEADLDSGNWYAAEYIVLQYDDVNKSVRKAELEKAREAILSGKTLTVATSDVKKKYLSETVVATEHAFTSLEYSEDFENAVKALKVGEVSEIIESYTAEGNPCFMLVRRLELSRSYINESYYDEVVSKYLAREYALYMTAKAETLEVVIAKKYSDTDLLDIE